MNETTTTKRSEFLFRRLGDSFDQFTDNVWQALPKWLAALVLLFVVARLVYRYSNAARPSGIRDATAFGVVWGLVLWIGGLLGYAAASEFSSMVANEKTDQLGTLAGLAGAVLLCGAGILAVFVFAGLSLVRYTKAPAHPPGEATTLGLAWGTGLSLATFVFWGLVAFYNRDGDQTRSAETVSSLFSGNAAKWYTLTAAIFLLGSVFVVWMYIKDTKTVRWYWAIPLALLRMTVYAVLCAVFLLPARQTWEDTNKQSRVVILLDITPSVTKVTDEIGSGAGRKPKTRMDHIIEFLTDENVAFMKNLLEKNPVAIYAFGTRLDESPQMVGQGESPWSKDEWQALSRYDFKPHVLRDLSAEGKERIKKVPEWYGDKPGNEDWARSWAARLKDPDLQKSVGLDSGGDPEQLKKDTEQLKKNLERLDSRITVASSIMLGTNVADSITAAIDRESGNMVQGIIVFSDGRSNLGSETGYAELRDRATREKIPVFTVVVGEDRENTSIIISSVIAPDSAPIDEAWKVVVEADGLGMAGKKVDVSLDLWLPGRDMKLAAADLTLPGQLEFAPGDPPHGQTEFVIDPAKLPENLTEESKDAAIKKRVLKEGKWSARARIPKDPQEAFADPEHMRDRPDINVVQQKLRILLVAGAPVREFSFLRTLLVREVQDKRATLTTYVQNEAGTTNKLTAEDGEALIQHFPDRLDLSNKKLDPLEKPYNLNEYDVIIAFDPDWSELSQTQAEDLARWVREGGGGIIYAAGPINTFQLATGREVAERLRPVLDILPVVPADIIAQRIKASPKTPRRLYLYPEKILGSELLKLDDKVVDDPKAGWEQFFTDRDKYVESKDLKEELFPHRGFFSCYPVLPVKETKPNSAVLAEFVDQSDSGEVVLFPWIVVNNPSAPYRSVFLASPELHKMRSFEPDIGTGREFFERFWVKFIKYAAAKRNVKAPRGRVLVNKEGVSGTPMRVQARILNDAAKPYAPGAITPKFKVVVEAPNGEKREEGPWVLAEKLGNAGAFDGYYAGQVQLDPKQFPPGDNLYRVIIEVPDSAGETLTSEFHVRKSDPEMDNVRPDFAAMLRMASDFDGNFRDTHLSSDKLKLSLEFSKELPKEGVMPKLAFKISDRKLLPQIPECMKSLKNTTENRGPVRDLWDLGVTMPTSDIEEPAYARKYFISWWSGQRLSLVLLVIVGLLALEWLTRKLLRLA